MKLEEIVLANEVAMESENDNMFNLSLKSENNNK